MRGVRGRSARFVCVIALVDGGRLLQTFRGAVEGAILEEPRGPHGFDATDEGKNRLLLERMRGVRGRSARFVCVIALVDGGRLLQTFRGAVEGAILEEPRG